MYSEAVFLGFVFLIAYVYSYQTSKSMLFNAYTWRFYTVTGGNGRAALRDAFKAVLVGYGLIFLFELPKLIVAIWG